MISPGAAARRIQTIVYERLLETDLSTVKGVVLMHKSRCHDTEQDKNSGDDPLRCNQLVRDRSLEIVERILKLIETLRPIAVVGRLPSNGWSVDADNSSILVEASKSSAMNKFLHS